MLEIGKNSFGCPLIGVYQPDDRMGWPSRMTINEGGRWFSALWLFGKELILAFNVLSWIGTVQWRVDWGLKPRVNRWNG